MLKVNLFVQTLILAPAVKHKKKGEGRTAIGYVLQNLTPYILRFRPEVGDFHILI